MRIIGVSGSLKRDSSNSNLLRAMATAASGGHELIVWEGLGDLPHFSPDRDGGRAVASLRRAITDSDAVLIATPEYAGGMPGSLKNALDWLVGTGELYGKPVAVVSAAPSVQRGVNARRWVEDVVGMEGGQIVVSFTVAIGPSAGDEESTLARKAWQRVLGSLEQARTVTLGR